MDWCHGLYSIKTKQLQLIAATRSSQLATKATNITVSKGRRNAAVDNDLVKGHRVPGTVGNSDNPALSHIAWSTAAVSTKYSLTAV